MESNLDQVRQELADIHEQLINLPTDAFAQRSELRDRQHELRQISARLVEAERAHDQEALKTAYQRLQEVRDRLIDQLLRSSSMSIEDAVNRSIDSGVSKDEIERRLEEILERLRNSR